MSYIGLDYDTRDVHFLRRMLFRIRRDFDVVSVRVFISPTGRGYHVKFITKDDLSDVDKIRIRKELGDDPRRISDIEGNYRDVLFDSKTIDGKKYRCKEIDLCSVLDFGREVLSDG
jgi:hypothetical protein